LKIEANKQKLRLFPLTFFFFLFGNLKLVSAASPSNNDVFFFSAIFIIITILLILGYELKSWFLHILVGILFITNGIYIFSRTFPGYENIYSIGSSSSWLFLTAWVFIGWGIIYFTMIIFQNLENIGVEEW
jgi:hypothetical protein